MRVKVYPSNIKDNATITLPPSKSIAHRAIICAALSKGTSVIDNVEFSEDILATLDATKKLGAGITRQENRLIITGVANQIADCPHEISCNESGSTLRFCIPIFALLNQNTIFLGKEHLMSRPLSVYEKLFKSLNLMFVKHNEYISIHGPLNAGNYTINGNISSQFVSGLFFALPLCKESSIITIKEPIGSYPYILLTIFMLKKFGIKIDLIDKNKFFIKGNQRYKACDITIEGDFSQFAYLSLLGVLNKPITFTNIPRNSLQGDFIFLDFLKKLKVKMQKNENHLTIAPTKVKGDVFDILNYPDVALALCVLGACCKDQITLTNAYRLEYKESNRALAIIEEFKKLNIDIAYDGLNLMIKGTIVPFHSKTKLNAHNDHRVFMALFMMSLQCDKPVTIYQAESINKSFPSFFKMMKSIGIKFDIIK